MKCSSLVLSTVLGAVAAFSSALPAGAQTLGCSTGGGGGPIPTSGTGGTGGVYPGTFPLYQLDVTLNVTSIPSGATAVTEVKLFGLTHTWVADLQFVLTAPGGARYNLFNRAPFSCDLNGDYVFVGECGGGMAFPSACSGTTIFTPGTYDQYYGTWPSGTSGVSNTSMYSIAAATGTWTLTVYDWAGADVGALTSFDVCFGTPPPLPAPTGTPTLTTPTNGSTACNPVGFSWSTVACSTGYDIDIDGAVTSVASASHSATLAAGAHTWMVRATNATGAGPWSSALAFNVAASPPVAPTLTSPGDTSTVCSSLTFTWAAVPCAVSYDIEIDGVATNVATNSYATTVANGPHTWRVRAWDSAAAGAYSTLWSFTGTGGSPPSTCVAGGAGGPIPTSGTGDGTWPGTLPTYPLIAPLTVTVPAGASQIVAVKLNGATHTWIGDLHFVLQEPGGQMHNLVHRVGLPTGSTCCGLNCDLNGNYAIYEAACTPWPTTCTGGTVPAGDYPQYFGTWTSGTNGILNTPMSAIPISSGVWNLHIYDWAGGDVGVLTDWELCFDSGSAPPPSYCTPTGPNSDGCTTAISAPIEPNTSHTSGCVITVTDLPGLRNGILFYGTAGPQAVNWCAAGQGTSQLCVIGPPWRTGIQDTGGTAGACDGTLVLDWDGYQLGTPGALGQPWGVGDQAWVQGWYRAPQDCRTTSLTEALELTYQ